MKIKPFHPVTKLLTLIGSLFGVTISIADIPDQSEFFQSFTSAVGEINGELSVDNKGAADYNVPIIVAPGIAGMQPNLNLRYNSHSGNGLLGVGWRLSGLSLIERCKPTVAQDGMVDNVDFDDNDRFCIDGMRLIKTATTGSDGLCDTGNSEYADGFYAEFKTEIESYSRIVACGIQESGPKYFRVWNKAGNTLDYGTSENSSVESNNHFGINEESGQDNILKWGLHRVSDIKGNYYEVDYYNTVEKVSIIHDGIDKGVPIIEFYPKDIKYTGNETQSLTPNRVVNFIYSDRSDNINWYSSGSKFVITKRLKKIETTIDTEQVREYRFHYKYSMASDRSLMDQMMECADGYCLSPTSFSWGEAEPGFAGAVELDFMSANQYQHLAYSKVGDFNGDGKQDLIFPSREVSPELIANGWYNEEAEGYFKWVYAYGDINGVSNPWAKVDIPDNRIKFSLYRHSSFHSLLDADNDGYSEFVHMSESWSEDGLYLACEDSEYGAGWLRQILLQVSEYQISDAFAPYNIPLNLQLSFGLSDSILHYKVDDKALCLSGPKYGLSGVDINGDGFKELLYTDRNLDLRIMNNSVSGFNAYPGYELDTGFYVESGFPSTERLSYTRDGANYLTFDGKASWILLAGGNYMQGRHHRLRDYSWTFQREMSSTRYSAAPVDINGDGRTDIIARKQIDGEFESSCDFLLSQSQVGEANKFLWVLTVPTCENLLVLDINGDGNHDWVYDPKSAPPLSPDYPTRVMMSKGISADEKDTNAIPYLDGDMWGGVKLIDYNADGMTDIIYPYVDSQSGKMEWFFLKSTGEGFELVNNPNNIEAKVSDYCPLITIYDPPDDRDNKFRNTCSNRHYVVIDIDGDGFQDIISQQKNGYGYTWYLYENLLGKSNEPIDKIKTITTGFGVSTSITYKPLSDPTVHENPGWIHTDNQRTMVIPLSVVTSISNDLISNDYQYFRMRFDRKRLENLWFERIRKIERHNNDRYIDNYYSQYFPVAGTLIQSEVYTLTNPDDNIYTNRVFESRSWFSYIEGWYTGSDRMYNSTDQKLGRRVIPINTVIETYGSDGQLEKTRTITFYDTDGDNRPLDDYGNLEKQVDIVEVDGMSRQSVELTTTYKYKTIIDDKNWLTGLLEEEASSSTRFDPHNGYSESARNLKSTYEYFSSGETHYGFLDCAHQLPDDTQKKITTCYDYDVYGNVIENDVSAHRGYPEQATVRDHRISKSQLDLFTINSLEQSRSVVPETSFSEINQTHKIYAKNGRTKSITDENGLVTSFQYDVFGRITREELPNNSYTITEYINDATCEMCSSNLPFAVRTTVYDSAGSSLPSTVIIYDKYKRERVVQSENMDGSAICESKLYYSTTSPSEGMYKGLLEKQTLPYACSVNNFLSLEISAPGISYRYDKLGRVTKEIKADSTEINYTFNGATSNGIEVIISEERTGVNGATILEEKIYTEGSGLVIKTVDANSVANLYGYDGLGYPSYVKVANSTYTITSPHDELGRQLELKDPNIGDQEYLYNGFGELVWQLDAKQTETTLKYDKLGRLIERNYKPSGASVASLTEQWDYPLGDMAINSVGKIGGMSNSNGYSERYAYYSTHGLLESVIQEFDDTYFTTGFYYDGFGDLVKTLLPSSRLPSEDVSSNIVINREFSNGFLSKVCSTPSLTSTCNSSGSEVLWAAHEYAPDGKVKRETRGAVTTTLNYDQNTRFLNSIVADAGNNRILDLSFEFDSLGNLESKSDLNRNQLEKSDLRPQAVFTNQQKLVYKYDSLNRLERVEAGGSLLNSYQYDLLGNITRKSDRGYYRYGEGGAPINAVTSVGKVPFGNGSSLPLGDASGDSKVSGVDISYAVNQITDVRDALGNAECDGNSVVDVRDLACILGKAKQADASDDLSGAMYIYDANGNMTFGNGRYIDYTLFNKPDRIEKANTTVEFDYGPEHNRHKKTVSKNGQTETVYYIGNVFEKITNAAGDVTFKHYVNVGNETVAVIEKSSQGKHTYFLHSDHLGSVEATTDSAGNEIERFAYGPFGERLKAFWESGNFPASMETGVANRSFTQHEYLDDDIGLIHMNGRVYDPDIGCFLSADPYVQLPFSTQGYNRYSYVNNNPMSYYDPFGFRMRGRDESEDEIEVNANYTPTQIFENCMNCYDYTAGTEDNLYHIELVTLSTVEYDSAVYDGTIGFSLQNYRDHVNYLNQVDDVGLDNLGWELTPTPVKLFEAAILFGAVVKSRGIWGNVPKGTPDITKAYKRPSGATTKAQRESVQGKPCVDCGATTSRQVADHKDPLVKEYYRTGTIDKTRMRDVDSVQPQCPTCSARQGAEMSRFSRQRKKEHGLE